VQSKFYQPDEHRAEKVRKLFATIARRYDLLNDVMTLGFHRHWKHRLVELAGQPHDVLDLCCGTGDIALRFTGRVVGVDFTEEMLRVAKTRNSGTGVPPVRKTEQPDSRARRPCHLLWLRADALRLPFPDSAFDVVAVGYGLRNLADIERGLCEIYRVLRPGGKLLSLDFGKPELVWLRKAFFAHLRFHLPLMGRWSCGDADAYSYILASLEAYPAQRGIKTLMEQIGYRDCGFEEFVGGTMAINFGRKLG
jgi:demethylmenaquinone methyltransferase/2-methoxy-6-polyprenyl-1,4-benzoquinol methylase